MNIKQIFLVVFLTLCSSMFPNIGFSATPSEVVVEMLPHPNLSTSTPKNIKDILEQIPISADYTAIVAVTYGKEDSPLLVKKCGHAALILKNPDSTLYTKCHLIQGKTPSLNAIEEEIETKKEYLKYLKTQPKTTTAQELCVGQIDAYERTRTSLIKRNKESNTKKLRAYRNNEENPDLLEVERYEEIKRLTLTISQYNLIIQSIESVERILNDDPDDQPNDDDKKHTSEVKNLNCLSFIGHVIPGELFEMKSFSRIPYFEQSFQEYESKPKKDRSRLKHYSKKAVDCICCGSCC